jgi:hypothetical protein
MLFLGIYALVFLGEKFWGLLCARCCRRFGNRNIWRDVARVKIWRTCVTWVLFLCVEAFLIALGIFLEVYRETTQNDDMNRAQTGLPLVLALFFLISAAVESCCFLSCMLRTYDSNPAKKRLAETLSFSSEDRIDDTHDEWEMVHPTGASVAAAAAAAAKNAAGTTAPPFVSV